MRRRTFIGASLGAVAGVIGGCAPGTVTREGSLYTGAALAFGTTVTVALFHSNQRQAELGIEDALNEARRVDRLMSIYSEASQVFQLNRDGELAHPDPHLLTVLAQASALSELSRGAFDITVQPLWQAYRDAGPAARPARPERIKAAAKVNWQRLETSAERVAFQRPGMAITLNGLAQGYGADLALAALQARGIEHALVNAGEFCARGYKPGPQPWTLGIADPRDVGIIAARLRMDGRSVATSGDYESTFTPDFVHHHIFDPATGESPQELASVTVLASSGLLADGLSTTFLVLGERKAHALAATLPGVDLMTINKRGIIWKSRGFPAAT